jgi:hypothetical protein
VTLAVTGAKTDERETLLDLLAAEPQLTAEHPGPTLIGDKNYFGRGFEQQLAELDIRLLRPARKGEPERPGSHLFKPLRRAAAEGRCGRPLRQAAAAGHRIDQ